VSIHMDKLIASFDHENKGRKLLNENTFFNELCSLMKNVEFAKFYDSHFNDWTDIECMIFYMKLYSTIDHEYKERFKKDITDETMTYMLHKIMTNSKSRAFAFYLFHNYKDKYGHKSSEGFRKELCFER
jgi:hypothetical protein